MNEQTDTEMSPHVSASLRGEIRALRIQRDALVAALSAVEGLLSSYPRMSNDPNGRQLLDAREIARAALKAVQS